MNAYSFVLQWSHFEMLIAAIAAITAVTAITVIPALTAITAIIYRYNCYYR